MRSPLLDLARVAVRLCARNEQLEKENQRLKRVLAAERAGRRSDADRHAADLAELDAYRSLPPRCCKRCGRELGPCWGCGCEQ